MTIFPDLESYIQKQTSLKIQEPDLEVIVYSELEKHLKLFIVRNYSKNLDEYINKGVMKEVLLSTILITLDVNDTTGHKLTDNDYLNQLRNTIKSLR